MEETNINLHSASISEIQSFFKDATVFITGATGFLGHVLLSKLLRSCSNIKEIYILLREKKGKTAINRFNELLEDEVFEVLRNECPESLLKIKPIIGDCLEIGLGLSFNDTEMIKKNVNVIFHVAATVKFDTPIKKAVHMNIRSTSDLLDLAHEIKELKTGGATGLVDAGIRNADPKCAGLINLAEVDAGGSCLKWTPCWPDVISRPTWSRAELDE
ncbi:hypothetical protein PGB90_009877 [Kerria lacca]